MSVKFTFRKRSLITHPNRPDGAIKSVPSTEGTILIITVSGARPVLNVALTNHQNYTGDNLHFGLAAQQARADGIKNIDILPVTDDVSVGRKGGGLVGRRALAGTVLGECEL